MDREELNNLIEDGSLTAERLQGIITEMGVENFKAMVLEPTKPKESDLHAANRGNADVNVLYKMASQDRADLLEFVVNEAEINIRDDLPIKDTDGYSILHAAASSRYGSRALEYLAVEQNVVVTKDMIQTLFEVVGFNQNTEAANFLESYYGGELKAFEVAGLFNNGKFISRDELVKFSEYYVSSSLILTGHDEKHISVKENYVIDESKDIYADSFNAEHPNGLEVPFPKEVSGYEVEEAIFDDPNIAHAVRNYALYNEYDIPRGGVDNIAPNGDAENPINLDEEQRLAEILERSGLEVLINEDGAMVVRGDMDGDDKEEELIISTPTTYRGEMSIDVKKTGFEKK